MDRSIPRIMALFTLLTFLVGGIAMPVLAHVVHPHVAETVLDSGPGVDVDSDEHCVLCDAAMPSADFAAPHSCVCIGHDLIQISTSTCVLPTAPGHTDARAPPTN